MTKLIINHELPDLNQEINEAKKHWSLYSRVKKRYTELVAYQCSKMEQIEKYPIRLAFRWYLKNKRKDPDNVAFAKKYVLDGLQMGGVIEGDSMKYIQGWQEEFFVDKENPRVEVSIF